MVVTLSDAPRASGRFPVMDEHCPSLLTLNRPIVHAVHVSEVDRRLFLLRSVIPRNRYISSFRHRATLGERYGVPPTAFTARRTEGAEYDYRDFCPHQGPDELGRGTLVWQLSRSAWSMEHLLRPAVAIARNASGPVSIRPASQKSCTGSWYFPPTSSLF